MKLRRLTPSGISQFAAYLANLKTDPTLDPPKHLLEEPLSSEPVADLEIEDKRFATRFDVAAYLDAKLSASDLTSPERDAGMWAWLTLLLFNQVCPRGAGGIRKVGENARYLLAFDVSRRYYRHLLLGPYAMFVAHRDNPKRLHALLANRLDVGTSETYRLFIENPALMTCRAVVSVATKLYYDPQKNSIRRGAGSKEQGGCRRLIDFLQQLDCTYDLPSMKEPQLISYLPSEFQRFIPKQLQLID